MSYDFEICPKCHTKYDPFYAKVCGGCHTPIEEIRKLRLDVPLAIAEMMTTGERKFSWKALKKLLHKQKLIKTQD